MNKDFPAGTLDSATARNQAMSPKSYDNHEPATVLGDLKLTEKLSN